MEPSKLKLVSVAIVSVQTGTSAFNSNSAVHSHKATDS